MSESATTDTVFRVLSHPYRRYVLASLFEHGSMSLASLADDVAIQAFERQLDRIPSDDVTRVSLSLYHTHLPLLAEAGMVEYDESAAKVSIGPGAAQAAPYLALADDMAPTVT